MTDKRPPLRAVPTETPAPIPLKPIQELLFAIRVSGGRVVAAEGLFTSAEKLDEVCQHMKDEYPTSEVYFGRAFARVKDKIDRHEIEVFEP